MQLNGTIYIVIWLLHYFDRQLNNNTWLCFLTTQNKNYKNNTKKWPHALIKPTNK